MAMFTPRSVSCLCLVALLVFNTSCVQIHRELKVQELRRLDAQLAYLADLNTFLDTHPQPDSTVDVTAFVSTEVINRALSKADGLTASIPDAANIILHVREIRADFADGYPRITVEASATRGNLALELSVAAMVHLKPDVGSQPPTAHILVEFIQVVPLLRWRDLSFRIRGLARDLLNVEASKYSGLMPDAVVPLQMIETIPIEGKKERKRTPTDGVPNGSTEIETTTQSFVIAGTFLFVKEIYLTNGIHLLIEYKGK